MQLAHHEAWICAVVYCLLQSDKRGGQRQKHYGDTYGKFLSSATILLLGPILRLLLVSEPQEFDVQEAEDD